MRYSTSSASLLQQCCLRDGGCRSAAKQIELKESKHEEEGFTKAGQADDAQGAKKRRTHEEGHAPEAFTQEASRRKALHRKEPEPSPFVLTYELRLPLMP